MGSRNSAPLTAPLGARPSQCRDIVLPTPPVLPRPLTLPVPTHPEHPHALRAARAIPGVAGCPWGLGMAGAGVGAVDVVTLLLLPWLGWVWGLGCSAHCRVWDGSRPCWALAGRKVSVEQTQASSSFTICSASIIILLPLNPELDQPHREQGWEAQPLPGVPWGQDSPPKGRTPPNQGCASHMVHTE